MTKKNNVKNQHYVPKMYLKNFCIDGKQDRVFEYNKYSKEIVFRKIDDICAQKYIYEVINENKEFILNNKNAIEDVFSVIEKEYDTTLRELFVKLDQFDAGAFVDFLNYDRESIISFFYFLFIRNDLSMKVFVNTFNNYFDKQIKKGEGVWAWMNFMPRFFCEYVSTIENVLIVFLRTSKEKPFITSSIPFYIDSTECFRYMPLSSRYAMVIKNNDCALRDLNKCEIIDVSEDIDKYNNLLAYTKATSFVSCNKMWLKRYKRL